MLAGATAYAYFRAFSFFSVTDDEGYILQTIRSYLDGGRLFDDVFTQYGPAFYTFESLVHRTLGAPLTHDDRAVYYGRDVGRRERRHGWHGAAAHALLARCCADPRRRLRPPDAPHRRARTSPGATGARHRARHARRDVEHDGSLSAKQAVVAGVLTGFALLVKVNIGAYLAVGFGVPALLSSRLPRTRLTGLLLSIVAAVACALPLVVARNSLGGMGLQLHRRHVRERRPPRSPLLAWPRRTSLPFDIVLRYALATVISGAALLLPVLLRGTSVAALVNGVLVRPSQFDTIFFLPLVLPGSSLVAAGSGVVLSLAWVVLVTTQTHPATCGHSDSQGRRLPLAGLYLCRAGFGSQLSYFTPFLWIVALTPGRRPIGARRPPSNSCAGRGLSDRCRRIRSPAVNSLSRPFLMIPIAFVCAHDAWVMLRGQRAGSGRYRGHCRSCSHSRVSSSTARPPPRRHGAARTMPASSSG